MRLILAAVIAIAAVPAAAKPPCGQRTEIVARLAERYGETLQSMGMHANKGLLEIYASGPGGTWTILVSTPDGMTCLIAAGQMWEGAIVPPKGDSL